MSERQTKLQKYSAPALEKGLDILEYLSLTNSHPTLSQLAAGIGRSKSEIFRMMIVLEERGYIQRHDGDVFTVTSKLTILGGARTDNGKLVELAAPYLERLAERTELSNHMAVQQNDEFLVISSTAASQSYGLTVQVGYTGKLYKTAAGACLLSDVVDQSQRRKILGDFVSPEDMKKFPEFDSVIQACQENGYIDLHSSKTQSVVEISAPVRHLNSKLNVGVITIPYFATDLVDSEKQAVIAELLKIVQQLQQKITIVMPNPI